jgi:4'-phosphopantetheinyl transferase
MRATDVGQPLGVVASGASSAQLWYAWVGAHTGDVDRFSTKFLSEHERDHLNGYRIREAAERYVVTRSLVRAVLGERLGVEPRELRVSRTDTGKPVVSQGVHFNLSHSGDLILLAMSDQRPVGVDVERKREVLKVGALTQRWLSEAERGELTRLHERGVDASDAFLRVWSLKEAQLKALGVGISGAAGARLDLVSVLALDHLLEPLSAGRSSDSYVGAIAFA